MALETQEVRSLRNGDDMNCCWVHRQNTRQCCAQRRFLRQGNVLQQHFLRRAQGAPSGDAKRNGSDSNRILALCRITTCKCGPEERPPLRRWPADGQHGPKPWAQRASNGSRAFGGDGVEIAFFSHGPRLWNPGSGYRDDQAQMAVRPVTFEHGDERRHVVRADLADGTGHCPAGGGGEQMHIALVGAAR